MDKGDANNIYNEGEGVGDRYYYGNGDLQEYDSYGNEGANQLDNVVQIDQDTQMSQGIQMNKNNSRIDEIASQKNIINDRNQQAQNSKISSNNPLISEKDDIFGLDYPRSRKRANTTYGFHSSFQARKAAPPKLNSNKYQYQENTSQNQINAPMNLKNPLPKSSLAPSKVLNQSYSNNTSNLIKPYETKTSNYNSITCEKSMPRNLYTPQTHSHAFIVNGLVYYTRCPNCNYVLNVDPKSIQGSISKPNITQNNQRNYNNYKKDNYKSETSSNQREERRLREQKEREEKKLREKKDLEERLKRQREERDRKFREEREKKEREKKEQKEKQQRDFQRLMEQKEKERKEKRDKDQEQRYLRSQGNQPNQRKEYKYDIKIKTPEYYQNKTITKQVIENPTIPKNYYINEKGVVVIVPPKSVKTSVTKIVTVNKPVNSIYQTDGRASNMGFYQSQGVETKVIIKPYRK